VPRPKLTASQLLLLVAIYLTTTQNLEFWHEVLLTLPPGGDFQQGSFLVALYLLFTAALLVCLSLLTPGPLLKPVLSLLLLVASVCSYFMDSFGVIIDEAMMVNAVQTDSRESGELLGLHFIGHVLIQGALPALVVWVTRLRDRGAMHEALRRLATLLLALAAVVGGIGLKYKDFSLWARENRDMRLYMNPS
jgi:lipid A ethanolaminephosphotransferase